MKSRPSKTHAKPKKTKRLPAARTSTLSDEKERRQPLNDLALLAARVCNVPVAVLSVFGGEGVRLAGIVGNARKNPSFARTHNGTPAQHADFILVSDMKRAPKTVRDRIPVTMTGMKFYAAAPLVTAGGKVVGAISILDSKAHTFSGEWREALEAIARIAVSRLDTHETGAGAAANEINAGAREMEQGIEHGIAAVAGMVGEGVTLIDDQSRFHVYNDRMAEITGYTAAEAGGGEKFIRGLFPEGGGYPDIGGAIRTVIAQGKAPEVETVIKTKAGEAKHLFVSSAVVPFRGEKMLLSTFRDITVRKRLEMDLRENEEKFRAIFAHNPIPIWVFDYETLRIMEVNDAMVAKYGYTREELLSMQTVDIRAPQDLSGLMDNLREIRNHPSHSASAVHSLKNGRTIDVSITWNTFMFRHRRAVLVVAEDVSEMRRQNEALQRAIAAAEDANRTKSEFLANMSHEIRTPMNGVIGMTSLLLETILTHEQREYVETVRRSGVTLLAILNDILSFSQIEADEVTLGREDVSIEECVEDALDMLAAEAERRNIEMSFDIDPDVPGVIVGDGVRLRQVLVNLVSNAVKFTTEGGVAVRVSVADLAVDSTLVEFTVSDTGTGIPPQGRERLFKPFSQIDASPTRQHGGTGLGLAIASRLVKLMGGSIRYEPAAGSGSQFIFTIRAAIASSPGGTNSDMLRLRDKRALLLCGSKKTEERLVGLLQRWGVSAEVLPVVLGPSPLALPDAADVIIGNGDKPEALEMLDAIRRSGLKTPVILFATPAHRSEVAAKAGDATVLARSVRQSVLRKTLSRTFALHAPGMEEDGGGKEDRVLSSLRILLADDNAVNQMVMVGVLRSLGYQADVATNGREALEAALHAQYDIVFMDIQMPEMDGVEAARRILGELPPSRAPKIIALTADVLPEDRERCFSAGMVDYLTKPVMVDTLRETILRWSGGISDSPVGEREHVVSPPGVEERLSVLEAETDPEFVGELIDTFLFEGEKMLKEIGEAIAASDSARLHDRAHALKGSSLNLGAAELGMMCKALEEHGRLGLPMSDVPDLEPMIREFENLRAILVRFRGRNG